jgi:hypothetical protein
MLMRLRLSTRLRSRRPPGPLGWLALGCLVLAPSLAQAGPPAATPDRQAADFFEAKVRPVLVENCVGCHGPKAQKSGLRLDTREGLLKGGDGGPVVEPGDPAASPLVEAIRHEGDVKMPPKRRLDPRAVADLTEWVRMGLPWPDSGPTSPGAAPETTPTAAPAADRHWAFQPVHDPAVPRVDGSGDGGTSVDAFILARLKAQGLTPSPLADRRTLIRRVTFDLLGLPPTPEEVEAFVNDPEPDLDAYERLVERLLASPQYGERWARYWLDVARYADTKGYVFFQDANFPWASTYRDYVIEAFNQDKPYDRFVIEQLAADLLPQGEDRRALRALGFLTLGGRFMNNDHDIIDDRIDVVTRGLLGLTVTCARCHDHKFDPIPTRDYYALYGVFASSVEPDVPPLFEDPPQTEAYRKFAAELETRERALRAYTDGKFAALIRSSKTRAAEYMMAARSAQDRPNTEDFMLIADGNDLNPSMLLRWKVFLSRTRRRHDPVFAPWHALAALPDGEFAARARDLVRQWAEKPDPARPLNALVVKGLADRPPRSLAEAAGLYARLLNAADAIGHEAALRATLNGAEPGPLPVGALEELRQAFRGPDAPPTLPRSGLNDLALLPDRASQAEFQKLRNAVESWRATGPGAPPRAMTLRDLPTPVEPRVFLRGNPNNPGSPVPRQFLGVLAGPDRKPFQHGSGRLELARAIADPANPLTARVLVNRVWMHHFGAPLVGTPADFGLRSDPPSHPELLDHLAARFVRRGWSVKDLHRQIVLSQTYRQRSDDRPECEAVDPENVLLWRMNRRRLDFEATRDALLAASGKLDPVVGGPSVKGITAPGSTRRTLYGFLDRLNMPGLYRSFDFPDPNATSARRDATTTAPQALFLMNNPFAQQAARDLLRRPDVASRVAPEERVERVYRLLYGRAPTADDAALARDFLAAESRSHPEHAWERYVQALAMANEFVFID